jgi:hypothetical protein
MADVVVGAAMSGKKKETHTYGRWQCVVWSESEGRMEMI